MTLLLATSVSHALDSNSSISVYSTNPQNPEQYLSRSTASHVERLPLRPAILKYDPHHRFQTIEGFGAGLTDSAIITINKLAPLVRTNLLHTLFDPHEGLNVNVLRVPIGASDFSTDAYSYLDLPAGEVDNELLGFNASRTQATIDMIHEIRAINPDIKIMLTPWSPPGWMKTNGIMFNGQLKPEYFDAFARYIVKTIQTYEAENIPITYLTVQNEPYFGNDKYASTFMSTDDQISLIRDHLGPFLRRSGLSTKILGLDHNYIYRQDAERIYRETSEYLAGIAYHCYEGVIADLIGTTTPVYQTECTAIEDGTSFNKTLHFWLQSQIIDAGFVGNRMALGWNVVLDENHGPTIGYCLDCRGMLDVNLKNQTFKVNPEMIAIAHAGKFVMPGAHRIRTHDYKSSRFSYIAYLNPDGDVAMIIENKTNQAIAFAVPDQEQNLFRVNIPASGVVTVTIPAAEFYLSSFEAQ